MRSFAPLLLSLLFTAANCSSPPSSSKEQAIGTEESASAAKKPAEKVKPPPDFVESRRFSPARYAAMAKRLVPVGASVERAAASLVDIRLAAIERDFFEDDWLYRNGAMVLLGEERGRVVALTQRFYADIEYPDPRLIADGFGSAEIGPQHIDVYSSRSACQPTTNPECESHRFRLRSRGSESRDINAVESKSYDDHDITLLYFHKRSPIVAGRPTLGIDRPSQVVEQHIREAETLFGLRYNLVSDMSLAEMRRNIRVDSAGSRLLIMATGMVLSPIFSHLAGELTGSLNFPAEMVTKVEMTVKKELSKQLSGGAENFLDNLEGSSEAQARFALAPSLTAVEHIPQLHLADRVLDESGTLMLTSPAGEDVPVALAGLRSPQGSEERERLLAYLKGIAGAEMARVDLRGDDDVVRSVVVIPREKVNLNFELLRHGFVRLDIEDREALRTFPELREAAQAALEASTGFARDWREDLTYAEGVAEGAGTHGALEANEVAETAEDGGC